jgi:murein endopeptidase
LSPSREAELEENEEYFDGCDEGADALVWHAPSLEVLEFDEGRTFNSDLVFRYRQKLRQSA